jgi:hypothetical protein
MVKTETRQPEVIKTLRIEELTKEERAKLIHPKNTGDKDDSSN